VITGTLGQVRSTRGTGSSGTRITQGILVFLEETPFGRIRRVRRSTTAVSTHPPFDPELSAGYLRRAVGS
jgi:hypothetical protein